MVEQALADMARGAKRTFIPSRLHGADLAWSRAPAGLKLVVSEISAMMSRRGFLRAIAWAVPAGFVLPEVAKTIFLPAPMLVRPEDYLVTEESIADNLYNFSNRLSAGADLSEASLEEICRQLASYADPPGSIIVRPTRRIISSVEFASALV